MRKKKSSRIICLIIFCVTSNLLLAQTTDSLLITNNSQSFYDIVYMGESDGIEETSATELLKYLQQMSGANFTIENKKHVITGNLSLN